MNVTGGGGADVFGYAFPSLTSEARGDHARTATLLPDRSPWFLSKCTHHQQLGSHNLLSGHPPEHLARLAAWDRGGNR